MSSYSYDSSIEAPNAVYNGEKVYYDDVQSISKKAQWAVNYNIGGCMTWDISYEDFNNAKCGQGKFPLLNAAINALCGSSNTTTTTSSSNTNAVSSLSTSASSTTSSSTTTTTTVSLSTTPCN